MDIGRGGVPVLRDELGFDLGTAEAGRKEQAAGRKMSVTTRQEVGEDWAEPGQNVRRTKLVATHTEPSFFAKKREEINEMSSIVSRDN